MKITVFQTLILIVNLVFQTTLVDTSSCEMPMESSMSEIHGSMNDHSNHDMSMDTEQNTTLDCCAESCECLMFSCQVAISVNTSFNRISPNDPQTANLFSSPIHLGIKASIYRPPIFA